MFTGIITTLGTIALAEDRDGVRLLRVSLEDDTDFLSGAVVGDSIAVDGACLTAVRIASDHFEAELVASTLERTIAGSYTVGSVVNLERAMLMGGRLDGHLVQGHIDGTGRLSSVREDGGTRFLDFEVPDAVWQQTILHGSITLNGVSLTVNSLNAPNRCGVAIIPHTWGETNLGRLTPGDPVNVEGDLIGKYVRRLMEPGSHGDGATIRSDRG